MATPVTPLDTSDCTAMVVDTVFAVVEEPANRSHVSRLASPYHCSILCLKSAALALLTPQQRTSWIFVAEKVCFAGAPVIDDVFNLIADVFDEPAVSASTRYQYKTTAGPSYSPECPDATGKVTAVSFIAHNFSTPR